MEGARSKVQSSLEKGVSLSRRSEGVLHPFWLFVGSPKRNKRGTATDGITIKSKGPEEGISCLADGYFYQQGGERLRGRPHLAVVWWSRNERG